MFLLVSGRLIFIFGLFNSWVCCPYRLRYSSNCPHLKFRQPLFAYPSANGFLRFGVTEIHSASSNIEIDKKWIVRV
ncbi:MAG: hypothetical protein LBJ00_16615 [Planctomycetaceae bacterium]|nr:hypothetical protein [Planctomycetaceae bacterium]